MKINLVYHTPRQLGSGYMGSEGLKRAFEDNGLLNYSFNQNSGEGLDVLKLQESPIFFVRGFLNGRIPIVARSGNQFKACWQSESFYTRHGKQDSSTPICLENQNHFNMMFTCADTDLDMYEIPTYYLPSWSCIKVLDECGFPEFDGLGFIGGSQGREDFIEGDTRGILNCKRTKLFKDSVKTTRSLAELISKFNFLVSPPGRCFNGMCGRAFEIMACNRLCFQYLNKDTMPIISEYFEDGRNIVYWEDWADLYEKYDYYLEHPMEAKVIANNGYHLVRSKHNEAVRAHYIVDCMAIEHKKWGEDQALIPDVINEIYANL